MTAMGEKRWLDSSMDGRCELGEYVRLGEMSMERGTIAMTAGNECVRCVVNEKRPVKT